MIPSLNFLELSGTSFSGKTTLAVGEQARLMIDNEPIYRSSKLITSLPILNVTVSNYADEPIQVSLSGAANAVFTVDAKGYTTITDMPFDDLIIINSGNNSISTADVKVTCFNDLASIKKYSCCIKNGLIEKYRRTQ